MNLPDFELTPISVFNGWTAKREDTACASGPDFPAGSKVRQYLTMARSYPNLPMLVGCSANSAMQIYVAAAAHQAGVPGIIYTPRRKDPTAAQVYAKRYGAEIVEVSPGYLAYCQQQAKTRSKLLPNGCVRWDTLFALHDAAHQCKNIPDDTQRIVVATGSGLTAAGILAGLAEQNRHIPVLAVGVSDMTSEEDIINKARRITAKVLPMLVFVKTTLRYDDWVASTLPDGTPLDPFYAAKVISYVQPGDCFWIPGVRPVSSMPKEVQAIYA